MSEEVKAVHREPHPFVGLNNLHLFTGRTVAFVGKVDRIDEGTLYMKTNDGKNTFIFHFYLENFTNHKILIICNSADFKNNLLRYLLV
jgi:hypothetical protein